MLGLAPVVPSLCGDLEDLGKVLEQPNINMLGRKGEASQGGEKRQLRWQKETTRSPCAQSPT